MAVSPAMRRLLGLLQLEEEQRQAALASALGELKGLERALDATTANDRSGRRLVAASARTGDLADRLAGLVESAAARRKAAALEPRIEQSEQEAAAVRGQYLAKRVERRQAETLLREAAAREAAEAARRGQQSLDDWHLNRLHRAAAQARPAKAPGARPDEPHPDRRAKKNRA